MRVPQQRQGGNMNALMRAKMNQNTEAQLQNLAKFDNFVASQSDNKFQRNTPNPRRTF